MIRRFFFQAFLYSLAIVVLSLTAVTWYATDAFRDFYLRELRDGLTVRAMLMRKEVLDLLDAGEPNSLDQFCDRLGSETKMRVTIMLPDGEVLGDSDKSPERMDNHAGRPEVEFALRGETGSNIRYSSTLEQRMIYVAVPLYDGDKLRGVIRTSVSINAVDLTMRRLQHRVIFVGIMIAFGAACLGMIWSRRMARPIEELKRASARFASGDFESRLRIDASRELGELAESMNSMAGSLQRNMLEITAKNNELNAILSSMLEGVLAVDRDGRILSINQAAAAIFGTNGQAKGKNYLQVIRIPEMQEFVGRILNGESPIEKDFSVYDSAKRHLNGLGTALLDSEGETIGALLVLNDITKIRRLENVRRDFVANVSHEIKTPLTAIKGSVEALLDGAMKDKKDRRRFIEIIAKHSDRLNAIIEDILSLSKIEQSAEKSEIQLERCDLFDVAHTAADICQQKAETKNMRLKLPVDAHVYAMVDHSLLEQAVVNLIDNAIKYSEEGGEVEILLEQREDKACLRVRDHGCGIPRENLPRLFERFYRVDKARSRKLGGTGLGLAIVKHIVQAHDGEVLVDSVVEEGSTFSICLPLPEGGQDAA